MRDAEGNAVGWSPHFIMVVRVPGVDSPQLLRLKRDDRTILKQKWRDILARYPKRVDPSWHSFGRFAYDMGPRPEGHHLARKEPKKGFSKANCYWAPGDGRGGPRS